MYPRSEERGSGRRGERARRSLGFGPSGMVPRVSPTGGAQAHRREEATCRPYGGWGRGRGPPGPTRAAYSLRRRLAPAAAAGGKGREEEEEEEGIHGTPLAPGAVAVAVAPVGFGRRGCS